jgi:hypothetical protein
MHVGKGISYNSVDHIVRGRGEGSAHENRKIPGTCANAFNFKLTHRGTSFCTTQTRDQ